MGAPCALVSHHPARPSDEASFWNEFSGLERGLGLLRDRAERGRVAYGEVGEHLPVELDVRLPAAGDELVVREAVRARARVDALDPQAAEDALAVLAVPVRVDERVLDLLLRVAVRGLLQPPVAFRLLEDLAALLARVDGTLQARHPRISSSFITA